MFLCPFCPHGRLPPKCHLSEENSSYIFVEANKQPPKASQTCYSLSSRNDPSLATMLTLVQNLTQKHNFPKLKKCSHPSLIILQEEQRVAVRHLQEVSVGLLGVCLVLCLAASLTNSFLHRTNWNELEQQNVTRFFILPHHIVCVFL